MILVAEDNELLRELALRQLQMLGLSGETAANGQEVLERLARRRYDLILMDICMPGMDGFQATRALREAERASSSRRTPVIGVTGVSNRDQCLEAGLDDFVAKPLMIEQLQTVLQRWLPRRLTRDKHQDLVMAIGVAVSRRREELGLSRKEVAKRSGLSEVVVFRVEQGVGDIELVCISRITRALDMAVSNLIGWAELLSREGDILGR